MRNAPQVVSHSVLPIYTMTGDPFQVMKTQVISIQYEDDFNLSIVFDIVLLEVSPKKNPANHLKILMSCTLIFNYYLIIILHWMGPSIFTIRACCRPVTIRLGLFTRPFRRWNAALGIPEITLNHTQFGFSGIHPIVEFRWVNLWDRVDAFSSASPKRSGNPYAWVSSTRTLDWQWASHRFP